MLLLDTCTFVWLTSNPERLTGLAVKAIEAEDDIYLSDVSVWELCLKWEAKKLTLPTPPRTWITEQMRVWCLLRTQIEAEHLYRCTELPELHRDPFDRLLVAQALSQGASIVTPDTAIRQYPVAVIW